MCNYYFYWMKNGYFPLQLIEHESYYSVVLSDFHLLDIDGGGYAAERWAKKILKGQPFEKDIKFDSEAGMFTAYSDKPESLQALCKRIRDVANISEEDNLVNSGFKPAISFEEAEQLLLKGFVLGLDEQAQERFLKNVPCPPTPKIQQQCLDDILNGTDEEKIKAARKINNEARTKWRMWEHYLSHPDTISTMLKACDSTDNNKVFEALIWALVFICKRHLPDLRTLPYFTLALQNKSANVRLLGLWGLNELALYPKDEVEKLKDDKAAKVKDYACELLKYKKKVDKLPFS